MLHSRVCPTFDLPQILPAKQTNGTQIGRIHFTLHYKDLDESARATVWRNFFESASASKSGNHFNISDRDITTLAKLQLNGRQV